MAGFLISMGVILTLGLGAGAWVWFSIPQIHREMREQAQTNSLGPTG
jgi:hypothetical protein